MVSCKHCTERCLNTCYENRTCSYKDFWDASACIEFLGEYRIAGRSKSHRDAVALWGNIQNRTRCPIISTLAYGELVKNLLKDSKQEDQPKLQNLCFQFIPSNFQIINLNFKKRNVLELEEDLVETLHGLKESTGLQMGFADRVNICTALIYGCVHFVTTESIIEGDQLTINAFVKSYNERRENSGRPKLRSLKILRIETGNRAHHQ